MTSFPPTGPKTWSTLFPGCGGSRQSPVHIRTNDVIGKLGHPFQLSDHSNGSGKWTITNNGHTGELFGFRTVTSPQLPGDNWLRNASN